MVGLGATKAAYQHAFRLGKMPRGSLASIEIRAFGLVRPPVAEECRRFLSNFRYILFMPKSVSRKAQVIASREVYRGPVFWITTDHVIEPGGVKVRRDVVHHTGSVVILAVEESRATPHVLLERQYRHAAQKFLWELPAGRVDEGESDLAAARRELLEETGYTAGRWQRILKFYATPGFVAETMAVYMARELRPGIAQPEADEIIRKRLFPLPVAVRMAVSGTIQDAKTIASVLWLAQAKSARKPRR